MNGIQSNNALSGLSTGNFDNITSINYETTISNQKILYLDGLTSNVQQQINNISNTSTISGSYVTTSLLTSTLNNYCTNALLTSTLNNYCTQLSISGLYVTNALLTSTLNNYATISNLNTTNSNVSSLQTLLTGASYDSNGYYLNLNNNMHIYGTLYIGPNSNLINVNSTLNGLSTTYLSKADASTIYPTITYAANNYALKTSIDTTNSNVSALQLLMTRATWNVNYNILVYSYNLQINGFLWCTGYGGARIEMYGAVAALPTTYLKISDASTIYASISSLSNYITKGSSIYFNTANASLQFPSTFPTQAVNDGNSGLGIYWNHSGGQGETDLICYGQGGPGGLSIYGCNVTTNPTNIANFYSNSISMSFNPSFPSTTTIGDYGATTQFVNSNYQLISNMSNYLTTSDASTIYQLISNISNYLTTSSASTTYQPISNMTNYLTTSNASSTYSTIANLNTTNTNVSGLTTILTGASWDNVSKYLNLLNNLHVYGTLIIGTTNVNTVIGGLASTYLKITDASNTYLTINNASSTYLSKTNASSTYATKNDLIPLIAGVVTSDSFILANTAVITGLVTTTVEQGIAITALEGQMSTAEGNITTLEAKTSNQIVLNGFTQFSGNGLKVMDGITYKSIINSNGQSSWYGQMDIYANLNVNGSSNNGSISSNSISASSITGNTSITSGGTLNVTGISTLASTSISGGLTLNGINANIINNSSTFNKTCVFNDALTINGTVTSNSTISAAGLQCNNLSFINNLGNNTMSIGTNGGSFISPNTIFIGNANSTTILQGLVLFSGGTFNMNEYINQV